MLKSDPAEAPQPRPAWHALHLWQIQMVRDIVVVLAVIGVVHVGYLLRLVTVPMLLALALAYLLEPLVRVMTRPRWVSRQGAALAIILGAGLVVVLPVTLGIGLAVVQGVSYTRSVADNTRTLAAALEAEDPAAGRAQVERIGPAWAWMFDRISQAQESPAEAEPGANGEGESSTEPGAGEPAPRPGEGGNAADEADVPPDPASETSLPAMLERIAAGPPRAEDGFVAALFDRAAAWAGENQAALSRRVLGASIEAVGLLIITFTTIGTLVFSAFLTAFFFFFFSTGFGKVRDMASDLIPKMHSDLTIDLLRKMDAVIAGFVRGRLTVGASLAVFYSVGYWLVGVPAPLVIGLVVGVLSIAPYLPLVGIPVAIIAMLLEPSGVEWQRSLWWVLAAPTFVYMLGQVLDDYILSPQIQGKTTNMDTPSIVFASIAGGVLAGIYGVLLAIPVAACIKILLREVFWPRFQAWAEGRASDFLPLRKG